MAKCRSNVNTKALAERLNETAINDDGQDWWASALLREAAAALLDAAERLEAAEGRVAELDEYAELTRRSLARAEKVIEAARDVDDSWPRHLRGPKEPQSLFTEVLNNLSAALAALDSTQEVKG